MKVITLTLCPAFDLHADCADFAAGRENAVRVTSRHAGGKGVNISRALMACGTDSLAVVVLGRENGDDFSRALLQDRLCFEAIALDGRIRENLTVHAADGCETRISFPGFAADATLPGRVLTLLQDKLTPDTVLTLTGRLPEGVDMTAVHDFLEQMAARGVRVVIDSGSFSLSDLTRARPYLIKPNAQEISAYLGRPVSTFSDVADAARELVAGGIENVMISLGEQGALLCCAQGCFVATPPAVTPLSTIGAGDSAIAGFLHAAGRGLPPADCLAHAVALGTAACMTPGTRPPRARDFTALLPQICVRTKIKGDTGDKQHDK